MTFPIYLDYNATTPCDPRVLQAMLPYFSEIYGNPANGLHVLGRKAARAVEAAREQVAALINARPGEIIFTSGATESNHLAILGTAEYAPLGKRKIITCAVEHKAVLAPCKRLSDKGFEVVILPVDSDARVQLSELEKYLGEDTFLVSIQTANNEIGTLQPIHEIARLAHSCGAIIHTDAAQAVGKIPLSVKETEVDLLSLSGHKLYGPKGIGALFIRNGVKSIFIKPILEGGGQEFGLRAGTLNVPAIVGFGKACEIASSEIDTENSQLRELRDELEGNLLERIPNLIINARNAFRLPNTSNLILPNIEADVFLLNLPELSMSTGSACNTGAIEPSHVLQAMGISRQIARQSIRISIGRFTTKQEISIAINQIEEAIQRLSL